MLILVNFHHAQKRFNNTSDVPTIRPVYGKQLINLAQRHPHELMVMVGQLFMEKFNLCGSVVHWYLHAQLWKIASCQGMMITLMMKNQIARVIWHLMDIQCQKVRVIMSECIPYIRQCIVLVPEWLSNIVISLYFNDSYHALRVK